MNRQSMMRVVPRYPYSYPSGGTYVELGKLGAIVGLEALVGTFKTGVASGIATATASLAGSQFRSSLLSWVATLATGTAVMYALNLESQEKAHES
jgi:hypothetical protein